MRRKLKASGRDLVILAVTLVAALGTLGYILSQQSAFRLPSGLGGESYYRVNAEFTSARALVPGMGQPVTVSGVQVGDVADVRLDGDRALVTMELKRSFGPVYRNATILLRPRTPLKDMFVALDPGTAAAGTVPDGGRIPVSQTLANVDPQDVLDDLDPDVRAYLRTLLAVAAGGLRTSSAADPGLGAPSAEQVSNLRAALKEFAPIARHQRQVTTALAARRRNLSRAIHSFAGVSTTLGAIDRDLASLVSDGAQTLRAVGSRDAELQEALGLLPSTLAQTRATLTKAGPLSDVLRTSTGKMVPFARQLGPALAGSVPFFRDTTPVLRDQLRPFTRSVTPIVAVARQGATDLSPAARSLGSALGTVNALVNALAYNPPGSEEGYLFWASWLGHLATSVSAYQDAHGAAPRGVFLATCPQLDALNQVRLGNPALGPILTLLNPADRLKVCPTSTAGATP